MTYSFNLVDQQWIPCLFLGQERPRDTSLREVFAQAQDIHEIVDPSPLVTVALHRLLLAILHRNFGPEDEDAWGRIWEAGAWDTRRLDDYFGRWHNRFDLFDEQWPFYQVPTLPRESATSVAKISHEFSVGNNPSLFDHSVDAAPPGLLPSSAARRLVALQSFAVGGLVSFEKGNSRHRSARAAPLVKGAVLLVGGGTLFSTLMANLHRMNGNQSAPFAFDPTDDSPAWEQEAVPEPIERYPRGYLDLMTWQSRRVLLLPETAGDENTIVRRTVIMKGCQFPDEYESRGHETMVAFRRNLRAARGQDPWPPVGFSEERALWRDSVPLFQRIEEQHSRPMTFDWLADLEQQGAIDAGTPLTLDAFGLNSDRAKVFFWRHERLPLPFTFLTDRALTDRLGEALDCAESVGGLLQERFVNSGGGKPRPSPLYLLATLLLAPESDDPEKPTPGKKDVQALVKSLAPERPYWASLDTPFRRLVVDLAESYERDEGDAALRVWAEAVRDSATHAFHGVAASLQSTARELKAVAVAERAFSRQLGQIVDPYLTHSKEGST